MNLLEILTAVGLLVAVPTAVAALIQVATSNRNALIRQGKHDQETTQMKADIERLFEKARTQEACTAESNMAIAETRNDIKWIRDSLTEIKAFFAERKKE